MEKNKRQITFIVLAIVIGIGLVFAIALFFRSDTPEEQTEIKGDIVSFIAHRPDFIVRGNNLSEVKIYGIESPSSITHTLLATAEKTDRIGETDVWKASIPIEPIVLSQIYVDAIDVNGNKVDRFYFALSGNSEIFNALWLDNPAEVVSMKIGGEVTVGGLRIEILNLVRDNRCPIGVECVTAGGVELDLLISSETLNEKVSIATDKNPVSIAGKNISIQQVKPDPVVAEDILESEYRFIIIVEQESKG